MSLGLGFGFFANKVSAPAAASAVDWRVLVTLNDEGSHAGFTEIEMATSVAGADVTFGETFSASSVFNASFNADKAFDDNTGTDWASNLGSLPEWIRVTFAVAKNIVQLKLKARSAGAEAQGPTNFKLQKSSDGFVSNIVDVITRTGEPSWTAGETRTYTAP